MIRALRSALAAMMLLVTMVALGSRADAAPSTCHGKFVNPITDVCWSCLFPLSVGALKIWPSNRPDPKNPASPICACADPLPRIGISVGFWEPARLADVTMKPWCFPNLGGIKIAPGFDIGQGYLAGPSMVGGRSQSTAKWHVHWYVYPLLYWMEILTDFACFEQASFDIAYMTEIDPLWQDDSLAALINPEAVVFANPIAQAACAGDCVASTVNLPIDPLFWCAGCQGPMYPLNGNIPASIGHVQSSRLALSRFAYKMHREALAWGTMGSAGLCKKYLMPIMRKQQYRFQMVNPIPTVSGRFACSAIGASTMPPDAGRAYPVGGEDMGYLVWRKRNCCVLQGNQIMRLILIGILATFGIASVSALLAQTVDGLDVQAVKKRSADMAAEAQAFVEHVKDRGEQFREEAVTVRENGTDNMRRVSAKDLPKGSAGPVDFDELVSGAVSNANARGGEAPQFIVFASLSMPEASLRALIRDTARAGGVVVFRGFPDNSAKAFVARLGRVVEQGQFASIGIDPRLFRAFGVRAVPTYVSVSSDFDLCAGFSCYTKVPPHDRMTGNVTVEYALSTFIDGNGPGARVAAVAMSNLKRSNP